MNEDKPDPQRIDTRLPFHGGELMLSVDPYRSEDDETLRHFAVGYMREVDGVRRAMSYTIEVHTDKPGLRILDECTHRDEAIGHHKHDPRPQQNCPWLGGHNCYTDSCSMFTDVASQRSLLANLLDSWEMWTGFKGYADEAFTEGFHLFCELSRWDDNSTTLPAFEVVHAMTKDGVRVCAQVSLDAKHAIQLDVDHDELHIKLCNAGSTLRMEITARWVFTEDEHYIVLGE